jgi:hypothetical protein
MYSIFILGALAVPTYVFSKPASVLPPLAAAGHGVSLPTLARRGTPDRRTTADNIVSIDDANKFWYRIIVYFARGGQKLIFAPCGAA